MTALIATSYNLSYVNYRTYVQYDRLTCPALHADVRSRFFALCNRRATRIKLLWYHEGGFYVAAKRLDRGSIDWPRDEGGAARMSATQLETLLKGVEFRKPFLCRIR